MNAYTYISGQRYKVVRIDAHGNVFGRPVSAAPYTESFLGHREELRFVQAVK